MKAQGKKLHHHRTRRGERELDVGDSTCIASAFYSPKDKLLTVEFVKGGGTYQFDGVGNGTAKRIENEDAGVVLNTEVLD